MFQSGSNYIVTYGDLFYGIGTIDSNGDIIKKVNYSNPQAWEFLTHTSKQYNGELHLMGHNFWVDSLQTNIGNYKGYVMVCDTFGNFKKKFHIKRPTTIFNRVYNGTYLNNSYYFVDSDFDTVVNNLDTFKMRLFCCKTDTNGNILWYKSFSNLNFGIGLKVGFSFTYDSSSLLIGGDKFDSIVGPYNTSYSYYLIQIDTNGNFIKTIDIPELAKKKNYSVADPIQFIYRIFDKKYLLGGYRQHYILDEQ